MHIVPSKFITAHLREPANVLESSARYQASSVESEEVLVEAQWRRSEDSVESEEVLGCERNEITNAEERIV